MPAPGPAVTEAQVLEALRQVRDPARGTDIVSAGMVSGVTVRDGHVGLSIEVEPARAQAMEPVRKAAEQAIDRIPGVLTVTAVLTAERPAPAPAAAPGRGPGGAKPGVPGVRSIIAVASGKGGVGKSTTAVNLALGLRDLGLSVGLLDADIYGPSAPRMMGIAGRVTGSRDQPIQPMRNYGIAVMSIGFLVPEDTPMIWRGPMVTSALDSLLREVEWGNLDILVVDMPPGTGDTQLSLTQRVPLAGAVIVSTPQDIALLDARKGLNMFRKVEVPVLGIVENMSYYLCPNCGHRAEIFGHGGAQQEAEKLGVPFLGEVPLDTLLRETADGGRPIVATEPNSPHAVVYREIADRVWAQVARGLGARTAPRIVVT